MFDYRAASDGGNAGRLLAKGCSPGRPGGRDCVVGSRLLHPLPFTVDPIFARQIFGRWREWWVLSLFHCCTYISGMPDDATRDGGSRSYPSIAFNIHDALMMGGQQTDERTKRRNYYRVIVDAVIHNLAVPGNEKYCSSNTRYRPIVRETMYPDIYKQRKGRDPWKRYDDTRPSRLGQSRYLC